MRNGCRRVFPLVALSLCLGPGARASELVLEQPVHHLDRLAREPMVVLHPSGTLFVSGYGSQVTGTDPEAVPRLWKSSDGGAHWETVDVGTAAEGAAGNSDVDLAVGPDGTLYFLAMGFDRTKGEGTHIAIGASPDIGASWNWTRLSETRFDDRPWVEVAPDGTAHAVWNDDHGVSHAVSNDAGRTWEERERIQREGGSSHLAVGPEGRVAVRIAPIAASGNRFFEGVDRIAVSSDGGSTWTTHPAPGERDWDPTFREPDAVPRWVEPVAWDAAGALYSLWSEGWRVRLARSVDSGASWDTWTVGEETATAYFPYAVARGSGEVAATWFVGSGDALRVRLVAVRVPEAATSPLEVWRSEPFGIDAWQEVDEPEPARTPAGEYVPVVFLPGGGLGVATPIQDRPRDRWGFSWWTAQKR